VFGHRPLAGNQLAVVVDSEGLDTADMLAITRWLDFSETTFLLPPSTSEADYLVRIFTPGGELAFAGHPTLGSGHVWMSLADAGPVQAREEIVQECGAGLVRLRRSGDLISFRAPPLVREGEVGADELGTIAAVLGVEIGDIVAARWIDNGPGWVGVLLEDAEAVLAVEPDRSPRGDGTPDIGVIGMYPEGSEYAYEVRALFAGAHGELREDPVTGSLNASAAQWMLDEGRVEAPYLASQGARVGRVGRVHVSRDETGAVWVGGRVFDVVAGVYTV
jgi:PhzF family phenazine biosynthesis protein